MWTLRAWRQQRIIWRTPYTREHWREVRTRLPILDGLEITAKTAGNAIIEDALFEVRRSIERGETVAGPLKTTGVFPGMATHYSGSGFSGMTFKFHGLSQDGFDQWVQKAKTEGKALDKSTYLNLAQPSERDPVQRFASVEEGLYDKVLNRCVEDGKMCMHHMMAIDERGGEAFVKAQGLNLPQDVCTVDNASQVVASLAARHISRAPTAQ